MDSWTLQGDSYSFIRSAPHTFSLCHREGTPNHVEIFDIINIPTQRSVISETTCLCDIFGDDGESASLSSSPAAGPSVPSQTEVEGRAAASPQVDDLNDSSGSYHTAPGSSEGEDSFDDSRERYNSPVWQKESLDGRQSDEKGLNSEDLQFKQDSISNFEPKTTTPVLVHNRCSPSSVSPLSQGLNSGGTTPFPGYNSPSTSSPERQLSSLSSLSAENRLLNLSPEIQELHTEIEPRTLIPSFKDRHDPSIQSLSPSPQQDLFKSESNQFNQNNSFSETHTHFCQDNTEVKTTTSLSSFIPCSVDSESPSERQQVSFELRNTSSPTTPASSPFFELSGRVSVPDLFSRGSTPDIKDSANTTKLISDLSIAVRDTATTSQSTDTGLSGSGSTVSTPGPQYTPPSPVISAATSPQLIEDTVSAEIRNTRSSPHLLSSAFPENTGSRVPSPASIPRIQNDITFSEIRNQISLPVVSNSLSPLTRDQQNKSPLEERYISPSPEIRIISSSPELKKKEQHSQASPSPGLQHSFSPLGERYISPTPEIAVISSSPDLNKNEQRSQLTPSPGLQHSSSPLEERYTSPSPVIGIVGPSPDLSRTEQSSQVKTVSESPLLEPHIDSTTPRSLTSSPQITEVSYSLVEPGDRTSPLFSGFSDISSLEPNEFLVSSKFGEDSVDTSVADSTGSQRNSPHLSENLSSASLSQQRNHTPSPQSSNLTPSSEQRYQTPSPEFQSPSFQCQHQSPETLFLGQRYKQSPTGLSTEFIKSVPLGNTSEFQTDSITAGVSKIPSPIHQAKEAVSPSCVLEKKEEIYTTKLESNSSLVEICTPISFLSDKTSHISQKQHIKGTEETKKEEYCQEGLSVVISTQEKRNTQTPISEEEELKSPSGDITSHRAASSEPLQREENLYTLVNSHSLRFNSDIYPTSWTCTPQNSRRQLLPKVIQDDRERLAGDMSRHLNKRRTPSPPLTRFTPVHIIAPQKSHRRWQNRSSSPLQVLTSTPRGNFKEAVINWESPNVDPVDNNSQAHWVGIGKQLEMDGEMPLEQERDVGMEKQMDRETDRLRKREELAPGRGKGWQGVASYRGEQVELSFNARNRKGPVSRSAAPTTRESRRGLPTAHSYSESLLATRQLQQQQNLLKLAPQPDFSGCSGHRRLNPPTSQDRRSAPRQVDRNRPYQSSSSSMGSELDEEDHEVKWLTDDAFRSLSSPEVDYLEMYNSSHCSSTNISQLSTHDSPAGVNAACLSYADFKGSAPKLDLDELSSHQQNSHSLDCLDPSRKYELGSFECIDVAMEREDCRKVRKGVPKRQIQLKRRNTIDGKQDESSENSSPGLPVMVESPCQEIHPRGALMRQHSTPAAMQETPPSENNSELSQQKERQSKLQKSASMDETCSKTKIASCLIKSVLSKKMQGVEREPSEKAREEEGPSTERMMASSEDSLKHDSCKLSSSLQPDLSHSSEGFSLRKEPVMKDPATLPKDQGIKSGYRPSSSSSNRSVTFSQSDSEEATSQTRKTELSSSKIKSNFNIPFESKTNGLHCWKTQESVTEESVEVPVWDTEAPLTHAGGKIQTRETNKDQECENKQEQSGLLQEEKDGYTSKKQEITLKAVEKRKASLNVCVTPEAESKSFPPYASGGQKEDKTEIKTEDKIQDEGHEDDRVKTPIHKVRDVRRLVKNTYNLSFKAVSHCNQSDNNDNDCNKEAKKEMPEEEERNASQEISGEERREGREESLMERTNEQKEDAKNSKTQILLYSSQNKINSSPGPQPMQIECKAVCWKDDINKLSSIKKDLSDKPQDSSVSSTEASSIRSTLKDTMEEKILQKPNERDTSISSERKETVTENLKVADSEKKPTLPTLARTDRKPPMLGSLPKLPSKEREVSTAVVLIRERSNKPSISTFSTQEEATGQIKTLVSDSPGPAASGGAAGSSGGHSVSMLLKEKGYQADIGPVVGDGQNSARAKGVPCKHVNSLEIPLQTSTPSERGFPESQRGRTFSSSSTTSDPSAMAEKADVPPGSIEEEGGDCIKPPKKVAETAKRDTQQKTPEPIIQKDTIGDFEAVKRQDPTFPPRSPAFRRFKPQSGETRSTLKETEKKEIPTSSLGNQRPQTIEVKSVAKNVQKPTVPPKPICKFKPGDLGNGVNESQRTSAVLCTGKQRNEERSQTIVVSSPTVYRRISSESIAASNSSRKLAVSAVSSLKPPPHRTTASTVSSVPNMPTVSSDTEAATERGQHQHPVASSKSCRHVKKSESLTTSETDLAVAPELVPEPNQNQKIRSTQSEPNQSNLVDSEGQLQYSRATCSHEQTLPVVSTTQRYTHQPHSRMVSNDQAQRIDKRHFYASDDPPSYDERESFSPLLLPDLTSVRLNRYQPTSHPPLCSCTTGYPSHSGPTSPHHHHSPHNLTPPGQPQSPGLGLPYQVTQPPLHPHHNRPETHQMSYQTRSSKSSPLGPNQQPSMYQSHHHSGVCASHPSLIQACHSDRSLVPQQHIGPRRPPVHRSPHQQPPSLTGTTYSDPCHSHSPVLPPMDSQCQCPPQSMGPSYGSEYGGDSSSVYSENSYAQPPRRVLLDPETGKYFYIEVPVQPLRKMLFDPETGQYVEVLIPQQAMSHSGLYPPAAAPFQPLHNPNIYAPAPQYMTCAPPSLAHPQAQPQPPQYPEASAAPPMHPSGPGINYRNSSGQGSKPEPKNYPPLDQRYMENMYYVPNVINASPNTTPPDYYHRHPANLPPTGGKRS